MSAAEYEWQEATAARASEIATDLESIVDTLNEVVVDHLRTAVDYKYDGRPRLDKDLQAARRAIEKAIHLLGS